MMMMMMMISSSYHDSDIYCFMDMVPEYVVSGVHRSCVSLNVQRFVRRIWTMNMQASQHDEERVQVE